MRASIEAADAPAIIVTKVAPQRSARSSARARWFAAAAGSDCTSTSPIVYQAQAAEISLASASSACSAATASAVRGSSA